jgi:2-polyprenyl-3-methyl-5-hydroxy-6-metoxy-1,4-benzoquinol methylase
MSAYYESFYERDETTPNARQQSRANRHFRRLRKMRPNPGCLLEVGAGDGYFLHAAKNAGWSVSGVELSAPRVQRAKQWFDLDLTLGNLSDASFAPASFDAAALFQLMEHVHDPRSILERVRTLLKPGGLLLISTPNVLAYVRKGRSVDTWRIPRHLFFFSPRTLVRLVEDCGFRPLGARIRLQVAAETRLNWQPWHKTKALSGFMRDLWTPFGLRLTAVRDHS